MSICGWKDVETRSREMRGGQVVSFVVHVIVWLAHLDCSICLQAKYRKYYHKKFHALHNESGYWCSLSTCSVSSFLTSANGLDVRAGCMEMLLFDPCQNGDGKVAF